MSASAETVVGEVFPRRSSRGALLGLSRAALACVLAGAVIAVFSMPVSGGVHGLLVTMPVWATLWLLGLTPMGAVGGKVVDWAPVAVSFAVRRATGQYQYRRPVWRTRPAGTLALPGSRARLRLYMDERDQTAFVHDPHKRTLTVTCKVTHGQFLMSDPASRQQSADGFAGLLASVGQADGVSRIQIQHRVMADGGVAVRSHWDQWEDKAADGAVRRNYEQLMSRSITSTENHQSSITITLDLNEVAGAVKSYGGGLKGGAAVLRERMRLLEDCLPSAGVTSRGWMTPDELAVIIRTAYDPELAVRLQQHPEEAGDLCEAGPVAVDSAWAHMRTDSGYHAVLQIHRWPRRRVGAGFLHPLVLMPGVKMAFTLVYRPIDTARAVRDAEHDDAREVDAKIDRQKAGRRDTVIHQRERSQARDHLMALDDGFEDMDHIALVAVTAQDRQSLDRAVEDVKSAVRRAKCNSWVLVGQQDELFDAAALPLGLGVR